jgi:sensor histidine kinase YesM
MNPHFIFNAMVGIQNYIYKEEPEIAANYLSSIVYLMRSIIENSHKEKVSLEKEIETLRHYLNLQRVRYDQKFDFSIEIAPEVEEESLFIPPMMAQPIIENAVEHGIMNKEDGEGFIRIKIGIEMYGFLTLTIEDNGIGRDKAKQLKRESGAHLSIATAITEERLAVINRKAKKKASMQIEDLKNENGQALGTRVLFHFPVN